MSYQCHLRQERTQASTHTHTHTYTLTHTHTRTHARRGYKVTHNLNYDPKETEVLFPIRKLLLVYLCIPNPQKHHTHNPTRTRVRAHTHTQANTHALTHTHAKTHARTHTDKNITRTHKMNKVA